MSGKRLWVSCAIAILAVSLAAGCEKSTSTVTSVAPIELNVSAAVSMKDALTEIRQNYQGLKPQVKINYNFGSSGTLQKQIEQGAPADLFVSAAAKQMDELAAKNLINQHTRRNLVENQLVMIVPKDSALGLQKFEDIANNGVKKIALGEPETVPAGQYAQQVLRKLNLWDITKDKAVLAKDVRTVLTYVETGNVEAGFVYRTDAAVSDKVQIITTAPAASHQPIVYPVAVLNEAAQTLAAEEFLTYLGSPEAKTVFEKYGFIVSK